VGRTPGPRGSPWTRSSPCGSSGQPLGRVTGTEPGRRSRTCRKAYSIHMLRMIVAAWILAAAARADQAVEVRVVNASTGAGIPDIALDFLRAGQIVYSGATDANGRFRIEAAKQGSYTVRYEAGKFWPAHDPPWVTFQVASGADPVHLKIEMYQSGKISGRVLDAAGKPVPNASLGLQEITPAGGMGLLFKADEKGEYSAVARRPGPWILTATPPLPGRHRAQTLPEPSLSAGPRLSILALPASNLQPQSLYRREASSGIWISNWSRFRCVVFAAWSSM
jgi:hypothetical protein